MNKPTSGKDMKGPEWNALHLLTKGSTQTGKSCRFFRPVIPSVLQGMIMNRIRARLRIACLLVAASLLGGIVSEALLLTFSFLKNHGSTPPVSSLWNNAVWVEGIALFLSASPG
jgi:hypothetical protein